MLCMSKTSKMVFVAFMQHCIQSTVTHLTHVEYVEDAKYYCTLYTAYRVLLLILLMSNMSKMPNTIVLCIQGPSSLQGEGYLFEPSALWV